MSCTRWRAACAALGLVGSVVCATGCDKTTVVNQPEDPVLRIVGTPPALPSAPEPPPPPPPPPPKVALEGQRITLLEPLGFVGKTPELDPAAEPVVEELVVLLESTPRLLLLSIEVHTDLVGNKRQNKKATQAQAEALRDRLVSAGVAAERLVAKGWGETQPLVEEETEDANQSNRRTELVILEMDPEATP